MSAQVQSTRAELTARKARLQLTSRARQLLERKQAALAHELVRTMDTVLEQSDALDRAAAAARLALARATSMAGPEAVQSVALATRDEYPLQISSSRVMGVHLPAIELVSRGADRGHPLRGTSLSIDEAAASFSAEVEAILRLARSEFRAKRLAQEIRRTARRLNALQHILIPRLESERDQIFRMIEERERAEHARLKLVKGLLARRRSATQGSTVNR